MHEGRQVCVAVAGALQAAWRGGLAGPLRLQRTRKSIQNRPSNTTCAWGLRARRNRASSVICTACRAVARAEPGVLIACRMLETCAAPTQPAPLLPPFQQCAPGCPRSTRRLCRSAPQTPAPPACRRGPGARPGSPPALAGARCGTEAGLWRIQRRPGHPAQPNTSSRTPAGHLLLAVSPCRSPCPPARRTHPRCRPARAPSALSAGGGGWRAPQTCCPPAGGGPPAAP